jgi:hypothetical protein
MDAATIAPTSGRLDLLAPPPLVVLALGAAIANKLQPGVFTPDLVSLDDQGNVNVPPGMAGPRWWAPELRRSADDVDEKAPSAALWSLGRFMLELALGRRLDDHVAVTLDLPAIAALVDVEGRPLPPRLVEVLAALLAADPAQRLQSTRAAARVCTDAAARFGDVDTALRSAARKRLQKVTADLPARDILSPGELASLRCQAAAAGLDIRSDHSLSATLPMLAAFPSGALPEHRQFNDDDGDALTPVPGTLAPTLLLPAVDVAPGLANTDDESDDDSARGDLVRFANEQRRERRMAAAIGVAVVIVVVAGFFASK